VEIILQVEEARIGQVERNQPAQISVAAFPGQQFGGAVASVAPTADPRSRTFAVRVYPTDPNNPLRDGMFAQVALQTAARTAVLVPVNAVVNRSGRNLVFVVGADGRVQSREVQVGINNGSQIEITQGVAAGEEVAISALDVLSDGTPVQATRQP
jgi:RND family efflux transporter MFP subunit